MQKGQMEQKSAKKVDGEGDSLIFGSAMVRNVCIYVVPARLPSLFEL